jgi:hypothetical protein
MSLESEVDDERVIIEISEPVTENDAADEVNETSISPTMKHAETMGIIDRGCWMRFRSGVAGESPDKDSFPWYKGDVECYVRLLWDLMPSDWRLVAFPDMPKDAYDPDEYLHAKQIMIADISEVLLEVDPSVSFRVYLGDSQQVVRLTPAPMNRRHAGAWVDAIFATMHLQNTEDEIAENGGQDANGTTVDDLLDLRERFYEANPELVPPEYENNEDDYIEGDNQKILVVHDSEQGGYTLGASIPEPKDRSSRRFSFNLDYGNIYGSNRNSTSSAHLEPSRDVCCVIS